jgi:hypothetical protein
MAEEEDDSGNMQRGVRAGRWTGQERDRGTVHKLQVKANKVLEDNMLSAVDCLLVNIRDLKHLPSLKLILELAARVRAEEELPEEEYRSLAEMLWKSYQEQEGEAGQGVVSLV